MDKTQEEIYLFLFRVWKIEATGNKIGKIKDKDNILKDIQFPKVNIISIDDFLKEITQANK